MRSRFLWMIVVKGVQIFVGHSFKCAQSPFNVLFYALATLHDHLWQKAYYGI